MNEASLEVSDIWIMDAQLALLKINAQEALWGVGHLTARV